MLLPRVLTVLLVLPLFLAALLRLPQIGWGGVLLLIVVLGCLEWGRLIALSLPAQVLYCSLVLATCLLVGSDILHPGAAPVLLGVALAVWSLVVPLWLRGTAAPSKAMLAACGLVMLSAAWYALYDLQQSAPRLLALMCVVWIADTGAYFAGRAFGRRKLAPRISPGKTWEGVIGGVAGVALYYVVVWWLWGPTFLSETRLLDLFVVAGMTVLSVEGDLFESWLKRRAGVKDSGALLPGHGGVLDRIDGVLAAVPFAALLTHAVRG